MSTSALIWTTPRARRMGRKPRSTARIAALVVSSDGRNRPSSGQTHRELDGELERAPRDDAPRQPGGEAVGVHPRAGQHQHRDLRQVPHHRRGVGEEELPVAVEDAQAPRREHQQPGAGEEDAGQLHRLGERLGPGLGEATDHHAGQSTARRRCPAPPARPPAATGARTPRLPPGRRPRAGPRRGAGSRPG